MIITLIILGLSIVFFISGKVRPDLVALSSLLALMLFNILTPEEAFSGFSSSIVVMMIGLFIVGGGIFQTGLAKITSNKIMTLAGKSPFRLYLLVMITTSAIGGFISNTGTVALLLPIVVSLAAGANISPSRLLMPLAFASSMGGMVTLIGTPPNLIINNELVKAGFEELSFFSFTPIGLICIALGTIALWPLSKKFLSQKKDGKKEQQNKKSSIDLAIEYQLSKNLYRIRVKKHSLLTNKKIHELNIAQKYQVSIVEITQKIPGRQLFTKTVVQKMVNPSTVIEDKDILFVSGTPDDVTRFLTENKLDWEDKGADGKGVPYTGKLSFDEIGLAEVVVLSNSRLVNQKVRDSRFRELYKVNILGIQRRKQYILQNLKDEKIHAGDSLLVQGEWKDIDRLSEETAEWVIVGQPLSEASKITLDHKAPLAALIMVGMVIIMAFEILPAVTAVMLAALIMVLSGCLRNVEAAYQTINWESILLIGGMLPMSLALEKTGVSIAISNVLVNELGNMGPAFVLGGIYLATSMLTLFISNTATAVLFAPIAIQSAIHMEVNPLPFLFAVTVAASMCFASPFSTPPNALVMSAGRYNFMDYVKVGLPLQILFAIVMILVLPMLFPF